MAIVQEMNLNMIPDSTPVIVRVDQYDTGTGRLVAHLFAGDKMYTPAAGSTATIQGTKPDMHGFAYDAVLEDATVTADLTQQMSCVAGNTRCQFVVVEPTGRTGTFCFVLKVQESALSDDTDISETELPPIIDAAEKNAERAEAAVVHYPYIDMETLHWMVWDVTTEMWVDTGVVAKGSGYDAGTGIDITEGVISVDLTAGENVQIEGATISATDTTYDPATQTKAGLMSAEDKTKLDGIAAGAEVNVQANWSQNNTGADDFIKNKPTLGTAAAKNATNAVTAGSTDLVESGAVKTAIDTAISSAYKPAGPKTCAELIPALLVEANNGNVYNMTDDGQTTADFIEGAGKPIRAGDNVGVFKNGNVYKFDLLSGFIDTSGFQTKMITGTVEGQTTVEGALGALSTNKQPKTMSAPITVDGTQQTTVEGTLNAINTYAEGIKNGLGTAAAKNAISTVTDSADLVESGAVFDAIKASYADNGVLGAKNILPLSLSKLIEINTDGVWNNNVYTVNDVTFTILTNSDNNVTGITVNGTASNQILFHLGDTPQRGTYILNGCPEGGSYDNGYSIYVSGIYKADEGSGVIITLSGTAYDIRILIRSGVAITNKTFYPMIRLDSDTDPTYQPYAQTNRELTVNKCGNSVIASVENGSTASQAYAVGEHFIRDGAFCTCKQAISQGGSFTLNTNYTAGDVADVITDLENGLISSTRPWSGNTLTFNILQNNSIMYRLTAIESNSMHYVDTILVNRVDGIAKHDFGEAITCSYTSGKLVITLPSTDYYVYKMEQIKNGIN